ncbi:MAG TPA: vitamin B12 dependent-methionine synthase activation domain-containing protein, partial [Acidobacteriota bacterium]
KGIMQLPFVLQAAEVVKAALDLLEPRLPKIEKRLRGSMVLATVKGDVHDIGKNLVDIILRSNGFRVVNLGTNQSGADIAAAIEKHRPGHVGLSALLVRSTLEMSGILRQLQEKNIRVPVICGGAALTPAFVETVLKPAYKGKVYYAADAFAAIKIMAGTVPSPAAPGTAKKTAATPVPAVAPAPPRASRAAPFSGWKATSWTLEEILPFMNRRRLVRSRWRMREGDRAEQFFEQTLGLLKDKRIRRFAAVYGYFSCRRRGDTELLLNAGREEFSLVFPRRKKISLADYFSEEGDVSPLFIVTCGKAIPCLEKELFASDRYSRYLLLHGFAVELAETLAGRMHDLIRRELGFNGKRGVRFSPGYPAWPELADQQKLVRLLHAGRIGVSLSENFQLLPELSVSALVVCHPQAAYF